MCDRKCCLVEGEQVLNAKHLLAVGIKTQTPTTYCIFGLCLQTSNLKGKPHELEIELTSTGNISCKCSCKAGLSGFCKHSIALLLYINRSGLDNLSDISSTDLQQQWGQLKKTKRLYEPKPVSEFCHVKKIKSETSLQDFHHELCSCAPLSALAKHSVGRVLSSNVSGQNDQPYFQQFARQF